MARPPKYPGLTRPDIDIAGVVRELTSEQRALLDQLADGATIEVAARAALLSLRTANRRLGRIRTLFGTPTTREAVQEYQSYRDSS